MASISSIVKRRKLNLREVKAKFMIEHLDTQMNLSAMPCCFYLHSRSGWLPFLACDQVTMSIFTLKDQGLRRIGKWRKVHLLSWKDNAICSAKLHVWKIKDTSEEIIFLQE